MVGEFGKGRLVDTASWLGYLAATATVCSTVAVSSAGYATSLFIGDDAAAWCDNVFVSGLIIVMVAVNLVGASFVPTAQSIIVTAVLASSACFIVGTIREIDLDLLAFDGHPSWSKVIPSATLTSLAYMGFDVIT